MEELKMNRSENFNFALRRCLFFTWCNNLFVNSSKVCVLPEISLHIYHAIGPVRKQKLLGWYDSNLTVQANTVKNSSNRMTCQPSCVLINISQFSLPVSCRFMNGKVRENVEALFSLLSKYKLFVYGIEMWTRTARLIYFLFDLCGLELPAINDAPVRQCILFRFDGNLFKLISG